MGDIVCIASGSSLPLIIRPANKEMREEAKNWMRTGLFELVGTGYIQGSMHFWQNTGTRR